MSSAIQYDGGLTAYFAVSDLNASLKWYQEVLGFKLQYAMEEAGWAELESPVPGVLVGVSQVEKVPTPGGGGATLTWGVKNIDAARAAIEAHKVRFDGPTQTFGDMVKLATFFDPDGNKLMLYQSLRKAG